MNVFIEFLKNNGGTIIVALILLLMLALVAIKIFRDKKKGVSSCGCGCADCPMSGKCHANVDKKQ